MQRERRSILSSFLFAGMPEEAADACLGDTGWETAVFRRGEVLCSPSDYRCRLAFLVSGECDVRRGGEDGVTMNTLHPGDTFGILTLFSCRERYPSTVVARKETKAVFLDKAQVTSLMARDPAVAVNIIAFLTDRLEFLTDRVAAWTESGVEKRLANHLLGLWQRSGGTPVELNRKHTA